MKVIVIDRKVIDNSILLLGKIVNSEKIVTCYNKPSLQMAAWQRSGILNNV